MAPALPVFAGAPAPTGMASDAEGLHASSFIDRVYQAIHPINLTATFCLSNVRGSSL